MAKMRLVLNIEAPWIPDQDMQVDLIATAEDEAKTFLDIMYGPGSKVSGKMEVVDDKINVDM